MQIQKLKFLPSQYMIVITPPETIAEKVRQLKSEWNEEYKLSAYLDKPNLMLCTFTQFATAEASVTKILHAIAAEQEEILMDLADFGSFPTHTIFINLVTKNSLLNLVKTIRTKTQRVLTLGKDAQPYFNLEPNLIIARKLEHAKYNELWRETRCCTFSARFLARYMILLKKSNGENYRQIGRFVFENKKLMVSQSSLFE